MVIDGRGTRIWFIPAAARLRQEEARLLAMAERYRDAD